MPLTPLEKCLLGLLRNLTKHADEGMPEVRTKDFTWALQDANYALWLNNLPTADRFRKPCKGEKN